MLDNKNNKDNRNNRNNKDNNPNNELVWDFLNSTNADRIKGILFIHQSATIKQLCEGLGKGGSPKDTATLRMAIMRSNGEIEELKEKQNNQIVYVLSQETRAHLEYLIAKKKEEIKRRVQQETEASARIQAERGLWEDLRTALSKKKYILSIREDVAIIDLSTLSKYELPLFERLQKSPKEFIEKCAEMLSSFFAKKFKITFSGLDAVPKIMVEQLRCQNLDEVVCMDVKVLARSGIKPKISSSTFECRCGAILSVLQNSERFQWPTRCSCGNQGNFKPLSRDFVDFGRFQVDDINITSPIRNSLSCFFFDPLTKSEILSRLTPGKDVRVLGKLIEVIPVSSRGESSTICETHLEAYAVEELNPDRDLSDFSPEEIKSFKALQQKINEDGLKRVADSFAPDIEGHHEIKEALCIQSAQPRNNQNNPTRLKSNILLIGDPGTSKSLLMKFSERVNPNSKMGSCGSASSVGITASVDKDPSLGWICKPGLVLLARDLCILDEFNLLSEEDRAKLQQCFNERRLTVNKADVHASFDVSCGFLVAANPKQGLFDFNIPIQNQFSIFPPILNRIDLVFSIKDNPNHEKDRKVAQRMQRRERGTINPPLSVENLRDFFTYCRSIPEPTFSDEFDIKMPEEYAQLRQNKQEFRVNARIVEALQRLSKGIARLRGSPVCEIKDLKIALDLIRKSYNLGGSTL